MAKKLLICITITVLQIAPSITLAQQPTKIPRIGVVSGTGNANEPDSSSKLLRQALQGLDYFERENIPFEYRDIQDPRPDDFADRAHADAEGGAIGGVMKIRGDANS